MRFARRDVRDHIVCRKNDYEPSYALYGASQRWKVQKSTFARFLESIDSRLLQHNQR
jgi:hypothetical protein